MAQGIKSVAAGCGGCRSEAERTVAAGLALALLEFSGSQGVDRNELAERSGIDPAKLRLAANRIPFRKYVAVMKASKELCRDPALYRGVPKGTEQ